MFNKYLKYKYKYLKLKSELENMNKLTNLTELTELTNNNLSIPIENISNENMNYESININNNYLIVLHNSRIRCFISEFFENFNSNIRFKNCAILKLVINDSYATLNLVYEGEVNDSKNRKYYSTNPNTTETSIPFLELSSNKFNILDNITHTFYFIRHGEGTHNTKEGKRLSSKLSNLDASLTENGESQAYEAGIKLKELLGNESIKNVFVSVLKRTWQTIKCIYEIIYKESYPKVLIILPCSHELNFTKGEKCDGNSSQLIMGNENKSICKNNQSEEQCKIIKFNINSIEEKDLIIYWKLFNDFQIKRNQNKIKCRETDMIQIVFKFIHANSDNNLETGEYTLTFTK